LSIQQYNNEESIKVMGLKNSELCTYTNSCNLYIYNVFSYTEFILYEYTNIKSASLKPVIYSHRPPSKNKKWVTTAVAYDFFYI